MPYTCNLCSANFSRQDSLRRHRLSKHPESPMGTTRKINLKQGVSLVQPATSESEEDEDDDLVQREDEDEDEDVNNTENGDNMVVESEQGLSNSSLSLILHALHNADTGVHRLTKAQLRNIVEGADSDEIQSEDELESDSYDESDGEAFQQKQTASLTSNQIEYLTCVVKAAKRKVFDLTKAAFLNIIDFLN